MAKTTLKDVADQAGVSMTTASFAFSGKGRISTEVRDRILRTAKELGYNRVVLETATVLNEAITLYRKYGFKKFEIENPSSRCDQMYYKEI